MPETDHANTNGGFSENKWPTIGHPNSHCKPYYRLLQGVLVQNIPERVACMKVAVTRCFGVYARCDRRNSGPAEASGATLAEQRSDAC